MIRRVFILLLIVSLILFAMPGTSFAVSTGTADGTYDFGGTVGPVIDGNQKVGDKFLVTTGFVQSGTSLTAASQTNVNSNGFIFIDSEMTTLNRGYTFKDLGFSVTENSGITMNFISVTLYNASGAAINTFDNFNNARQTSRSMNRNTLQLSSWLNDGKPFNVNNVAKIKILWTFTNKVAPSKFKLDNITIAGVKSGYSVTYNGNGNTSGSVAIAYHTTGTTGTATSSGTLAKTGYTFAGWNTKADGTGTSYAAGAALTRITANKTLYAKWTLFPTYTITYDANGADSGNAPVDGNSYLSGDSAAVLGSGTLAKVGYSFVEWNTTADCAGTNYIAGATLTGITANVTLYAKWEEALIPTYTLTYDGNGSTAGAQPVDIGAYVHSASVTVLGKSTLEKAGYTFTSWNTKVDGTGISYAAGSTLTIDTANITLYAQWALFIAPPSPPITTPSNPSRVARVIAGNDPILQVQIYVTRIINSNGTKRDEITFDTSSASKILSLAKGNKKQTIRILFDDLPSAPADEMTVVLPKATIQQLRQDITLEITTNAATLILSRASLAALPDTDLRLTTIRHSGEQSALSIARPVTIESGGFNVPITLLFPLQQASLPSDLKALKGLLSSLKVNALRSDGAIEQKAGRIEYDDSGRPLGIKVDSTTDKTSTYTIVSFTFPKMVSLMKGYPNGTFRPDQQLTREELATILYRIVKGEGSPLMKGESFTDVAPNHWSAEAISVVSAMGLMAGDVDGDFHPYAPVSRAQTAEIIARWRKLSLEGKEATFEDVKGSAAEASIAAVAEMGYMIEGKDGKFHPDSPLTRSEAAMLFNRVTGREALTLQTEKIWSDVPKSHWAFFEIAGAKGSQE